MADANLSRWVLGSVAKHLHDAAAAVNLPLVVEFIDTRGAAWKAAPAKAEATISGPATRELSKGLHRVSATVTVIVSSDKLADANMMAHADRTGAIQAALDQCITVRQHEPGEDNPATIGFLTPRSGPGDAIPITNLKPGDGEQINHSTVEARYVGYFLEVS